MVKKIFILFLGFYIFFNVNYIKSETSQSNNLKSERNEVSKLDIPVNKDNPVAASSTLSGKPNISYSPSNILDFDEKTAWIEGSNKGGVGEWIEIYLGEGGVIKNITEVEVNILTHYQNMQFDEGIANFLKPVEFKLELYVDEKLVSTSNNKIDVYSKEISFVGIPYLLKSNIDNLQSGIIWLKITILKTENGWDNYGDIKDKNNNACIADVVINFKKDNPYNIREAVSKFANGINKKNKSIISEFTSKSFEEVLNDFTNEFDEEATPYCNPQTLRIHSEKIAFIYACEGGDGASWGKFKYDNEKWTYQGTCYFSNQ